MTPATTNQAGYARLRGVSRKTVTKWKHHGLLVFAANGEVDIVKTNAKQLGHFGVLRGVTK